MIKKEQPVAVKGEQLSILTDLNIQEFIKFDNKQMADEAKARGEEEHNSNSSDDNEPCNKHAV
jgi:hypothetical protein